MRINWLTTKLLRLMIIPLLVPVSLMISTTPAAIATPAYTIYDLGTLGGPSASALSINDYGQIVGLSEDRAGNYHPFVWTPVAPTSSTGSMIDLGVFGGSRGDAVDINASGQIVGDMYSDNGSDATPFLWTPTTPNGESGSMISLETLRGNSGLCAGINLIGQVAGVSPTSNSSDGSLPFLWTPNVANGSSGSTVNLGTFGGTPNGPISAAFSINSVGQVAGTTNTTASGNYHPFLWTPTNANGSSGSMVDLGTLGGSDGSGARINTSGQVAGYSSLSDGDSHAFLWTPTSPNGSSGSMVDLGTLGGSDSFASGINESGQVVGAADTSDGVFHAFVWTPNTTNADSGSMIELDSLPGSTNSNASEINDLGQIVGSVVVDGNSHAVLWMPTNTVKPAISGMSPTSGPVTGGTAITISGTGFNGATAVTFGGILVANPVVDSDTKIEVVSPAHAAGAVDVTVTTPEGTSATTGADQFTYRSSADLALTMTAISDSVVYGDNLTYTLTVKNNGPDASDAVTVSDVLPQDTVIGHASSSQGTCATTGQTITCDLGSLVDQAIATITIVVTPTKVEALHNVATVSATTDDPTPDNNQATQDTKVTALQRTSSNPNLAGYVATGKGEYRSVSGAWTVPTVECNGGLFQIFSSASFWVGLGGQGNANDQESEQIGVAVACKSLRPSYSAWIKLAPSAPEYLESSDYPITPGDDIQATVRYEDNGTYLFSMDNSTEHWSYAYEETRQDAVNSTARDSAEWIVEGQLFFNCPLKLTNKPFCQWIKPLADFGETAFADVTADGQPVTAGPVITQIVMKNGDQVKAQPTLNSDGTEIDIQWIHY